MLNQAPQPAPPDEMREFMLMLRQALLLIVSWIERRYGLERRRANR